MSQPTRSLPPSTQEVLEPLLRSIPLTELRALLRDTTLYQYIRDRLPQRLAHLRRYHGLAALDAVVLAVQEGDLDIAEDVIDQEEKRGNADLFLIELRALAVETRNASLLIYLIDITPLHLETTKEIILALVARSDLPLLTELLSQRPLSNNVLLIGTRFGELEIVKYAIAQGATVSDLAIAVTIGFDRSMENHDVIHYLRTVASTMPITAQMVVLAQELYPEIKPSIFEELIAGGVRVRHPAEVIYCHLLSVPRFEQLGARSTNRL